MVHSLPSALDNMAFAMLRTGMVNSCRSAKPDRSSSPIARTPSEFDKFFDGNNVRRTLMADPVRASLQRMQPYYWLSEANSPRRTGEAENREGTDVKVFISWSGEPGRSIARALSGWLRLVVQHVSPWMSDEQIASGTRWREVIGDALDGTNFGIICVTRHGLNSRWLMFEAGALAKHPDVARIVPLCIDVSPTEVTGPLDAWQSRQLDKSGVKRLVYDLSAASENRMASADLDRLFERLWPDLEQEVADARAKVPDTKPTPRSTESMLEELVERMRRLERRTSRPSAGRTISPGDTVTLPGGTTFLVPDDPDVVARIEDVMGLTDTLTAHVSTVVRPGTIHAKTNIPRPKVKPADEDDSKE
jgi:hypothetical protein